MERGCAMSNPYWPVGHNRHAYLEESKMYIKLFRMELYTGTSVHKMRPRIYFESNPWCRNAVFEGGRHYIELSWLHGKENINESEEERGT